MRLGAALLVPSTASVLFLACSAFRASSEGDAGAPGTTPDAGDGGADKDGARPGSTCKGTEFVFDGFMRDGVFDADWLATSADIPSLSKDAGLPPPALYARVGPAASNVLETVALSRVVRSLGPDFCVEADVYVNADLGSYTDPGSFMTLLAINPASGGRDMSVSVQLGGAIFQRDGLAPVPLALPLRTWTHLSVMSKYSPPSTSLVEVGGTPLGQPLEVDENVRDVQFQIGGTTRGPAGTAEVFVDNFRVTKL